MSPEPRHWLFAYGSLINSDSRDLSFRSAAAHVARVQGFQRGWYHTEHDQPLSGLVATPQPDVSINGILVGLDEDQLRHADAREVPFGYQRYTVGATAIATDTLILQAQDRIWIYAISEVNPATASTIYQSYLDVIMAGCLDISETFTREFLRTTSLWNGRWLDDRAVPVYMRAMTLAGRERVIDRLLAEELGGPFSQRQQVD